MMSNRAITALIYNLTFGLFSFLFLGVMVANAATGTNSGTKHINIHLVSDSIGYGYFSPKMFGQGYKGYVLDYINRLTANPKSKFTRDGGGSSSNPPTDFYYDGYKINYVGLEIMPTSMGFSDSAAPSENVNLMASTKNYLATAFPGRTILDSIDVLSQDSKKHPLLTKGAIAPQSVNYTDDDFISIVQLGTNDVSALCELDGQNQMTPTAKTNIDNRVLQLIKPDYTADSISLIGLLYKRLSTDHNVPDANMAFMVFETPLRGPGDGADPKNICNAEFNKALKEQVTSANQLNKGPYINLIDQSNVPTDSDKSGGDNHVHPGDLGHAAMACNLFNGSQLALLSSMGSCSTNPKVTPQNGLIKVFTDLGL